MKEALHLTQEQKLQQRLSPQQVQFVRLLEMNSLEVEDEVRHEILDNPAIEVAEQDDSQKNGSEEGGDESEEKADDIAPDTTMARDADDPEDDADDTPDYRLNISNHSADDKVLEPIITSESTLIDYLTEQINEHDLSEKQQQIADYIIGSIDDNGYLTRSVSAISDDLIFQEGLDVTDGEINTVLQAIRELDPAGWRRSTCATVCCCSWNGCLERPKTYMPTRLSTNISPNFQKTLRQDYGGNETR